MISRSCCVDTALWSCCSACCRCLRALLRAIYYYRHNMAAAVEVRRWCHAGAVEAAHASKLTSSRRMLMKAVGWACCCVLLALFSGRRSLFGLALLPALLGLLAVIIGWEWRYVCAPWLLPSVDFERTVPTVALLTARCNSYSWRECNRGLRRSSLLHRHRRRYCCHRRHHRHNSSV